jgi:prepilin-type N-terminal cleavage/methylation domain-containing protein
VVRDERGFSLTELIVAIGIFSVVSTAFYQVLFSAREGGVTARNVTRISEEARLGFNRMVRDTREATDIRSPSATSYQIFVDFDQDNSPEPVPTDPTGNYELLTFSYVSANSTITVSNGTITEVLMRGVECLPKSPSGCQDVFTFGSSRLEWDTNGNGIASAAELDDIAGLGNSNDTIDGQELNFLDVVSFSFRIRSGESISNFYADAQLRNNR